MPTNSTSSPWVLALLAVLATSTGTLATLPPQITSAHSGTNGAVDPNGGSSAVILRNLTSTTVTVASEADLNANLKNDTTVELGADIFLSHTINVNRHQTGLVIDGMGLFKVDGQGAVQCFNIYISIDIALWNLVITNGNSSEGGGLFINSGTVSLVSCIVTANNAFKIGGGGMFIYTDVTVHLAFCTLSGNTASASPGYNASGGGLYLYGGATVSFVSCSVSDNTAANDGGGILFSGTDTTLLLAGSSFSGNSAPSGNDLHTTGTLTVLSSCRDGTFNIGTGTLDCDGCTDGPYAADLLCGSCSACPSPAPFSCCGATASGDCAATEPADCTVDELFVCSAPPTPAQPCAPTQEPSPKPSLIPSLIPTPKPTVLRTHLPTPGPVHVVSPQGTVYEYDLPLPIQWNTANQATCTTVQVYLYEDMGSGAAYKATLETNYPNDETVLIFWTPSNTTNPDNGLKFGSEIAGSGYFIRVECSIDFSGFSEAFNISLTAQPTLVPAPVPTKAPLPTYPTTPAPTSFAAVHLTSPQRASYEYDLPVPIQWNTFDASCTVVQVYLYKNSNNGTAYVATLATNYPNDKAVLIYWTPSNTINPDNGLKYEWGIVGASYSIRVECSVSSSSYSDLFNITLANPGPAA